MQFLINNVIFLEFNSQHGSQIGIIANIIADALNFETWFLCYSERYTVYTFYIFPAISWRATMNSAGLLFTVKHNSTRHADIHSALWPVDRI